jgi:PAS domain S-box-containing protein
MEKILHLFEKFNPKLDFNSDDEQLKNKILIILTLSAACSSLVYHFIAMYYGFTFLMYSSLSMVMLYAIVYFINLKGYLLTAKNLFVQFSNINLFLAVLYLPKETSFNILYAVLFFTIFSIYELKDKKIILLNALLLITSYVLLEIYVLNTVSVEPAHTSPLFVIFLLNMFFFTIGMITCIYFFIENNEKYKFEILTKEENLNAVIENSQKAIWSVDTDLRILTMNTNFKKITALINPIEPQRGDNILDYLPHKDINYLHWENICKSVLVGKKCIEELKIEYDGNDIYLEINAYPIKNLTKTITGIAFFGKDITKRKIHAEILNTKNNELLKANKELDLLVYRASHDLRAPLMSILGLIKITELEFKDTKAMVNLDLITKSVNKLDSYISDIINLSKNSRTELSYEKINFETIVDDLLDSLTYFEHSKYIEVVKNINKEAEFVSDLKRIEIVFNNLISNAIKYHNIHQDFPFIKISITQNYKEALIEISDNGIGVESNHIEHIFNMFYRASSNSKGSGLGLYIVKDAISKLKGKIDVSSEIGKGTSFKIIIPNYYIQK